MSENVKSKRPLLICLTPVRNEAWCLDAFLTCTSLWADYIIIADQNSTDGSRDIYKKYPKVVMVDNNDTDLHETNRQRLMFAEARKIPGDKIFIALDADEIFTANYFETDDWQKITHSKAGDVYVFQWAEIDPTAKKYNIPDMWYQWAIFDDGSNPSKDGKIHIARVPWPQNSEATEILINDFQVMHLQYLNKTRLHRKENYYQCFLLLHENKNAIAASRGIRDICLTKATQLIPDYFFENYKKQGIDILSLIDFSKTYCWQDEIVLEYFDEKGIHFFRKLNIWDKMWLAQISEVAGKEIKDPRNWNDKLLHLYLRKTQRFKHTTVIRGIDKILKKII